MKRALTAVVAAGCLLLLSGCSILGSVKQNQEISRLIRKDIIDFYENMSTAYYLLGAGYYRLHVLAKEQNDTQAANRYLQDAVMYKRFSEDLKATVKIWRKDYGLAGTTRGARQQSPGTAAPATAGAAASTEGQAYSQLPTTAGPSPVPQKKRSIIDRLRFWRKQR